MSLHAAVSALKTNAIIRYRKALFMCAASCQGGHSGAGAAAAECLGVPFPIEMRALIAKAIDDGYDPLELWPWSLAAKVAALKATTKVDVHQS